MATRERVILIIAGLLLLNSIRQSKLIRLYEASMGDFLEQKLDGKTMDSYVLPGKTAVMKFGKRVIVCGEVQGK